MDEWGYANRGSFVIDKDGRIAHMVVTNPTDARDPDEYLAALAAVQPRLPRSFDRVTDATDA